MQELFFQLDVSLFYFINKTLANPITDVFMPFITEFDNWLPIYILGFIFIIYKKKWQGVWIVLSLIIAAAIADQISASLIKPFVGRMRPCHTLPDVNLLVGCGAGKSFPSSHATNNFSAAIILAFYYRKQVSLFFIIASLVALSRVFVGVHYPIDIAFGALLGTVIGYIVYRIMSFSWQRISTKFFFLNK